MKKTKLVSLVLLLFPLLISCANNPTPNPGGDTSGGDTTPGGGDNPGGGDSGGGSSSEDEPELLEVNITAFNDFHGAILEQDGSMGLAKIGTYLKRRGAEDNTLTIDQGDDWQGSIYSNFNRGRLVNDVFAYARLSARTVGNHDFDWGIEPLKNNTARYYDNYQIPVLAANVYDYDFPTKVEGNTQQIDIGRKSITYTLKNGLKVGIVGVIGRDQLTSITSLYVQDVCFKDHVQVMKDEATRLRNEEKCDIVIGSIHAGRDAVTENNMENYVDLMLTGHAHSYDTYKEGSLNYYRFDANGQMLGDIKLTYDKKQKKVVETTLEVIDPSNIDAKIGQVDAKIQSIIDEYNSDCEESANEVLANGVPYYFDTNVKAPNLMCKAIYDRAISEGYDDIILSFCNEARSTINKGTIRYADLYQAFPFDNVVYIAEVSGSDILNEVVNWNCACFNPSFDGAINRYQTYKIAVLDFLLFHTNTSRYYNYFYSFNGTPLGQLSDNYRVILKDWLKDNGYNEGKTINAFDFESTDFDFDKSRIHEAY